MSQLWEENSVTRPFLKCWTVDNIPAMEEQIKSPIDHRGLLIIYISNAYYASRVGSESYPGAIN